MSETSVPFVQNSHVREPCIVPTPDLDHPIVASYLQEVREEVNLTCPNDDYEVCEYEAD